MRWWLISLVGWEVGVLVLGWLVGVTFCVWKALKEERRDQHE